MSTISPGATTNIRNPQFCILGDTGDCFFDYLKGDCVFEKVFDKSGVFEVGIEVVLGCDLGRVGHFYGNFSLEQT